MSYASGTMPVGYMECDIFLSSIEDDDHIIALDWIDAYGTGESERGWRLVYPPSNIDLRTPTGERGVVALGGAGMWGEQPAGFEFEETKTRDMSAAGWPAIKDVSSAFAGGPDERGVSIHDDLLVKVKDYASAVQLHKRLSEMSVARGGKALKWDYAPTQHGGVELERVAGGMYSHMAGYIKQLTHKWMPTLVETDKVPEGIPQGKELRDKLDKLEMEDGEGPLTKEQHDFQSIVGALRWPASRRVVSIMRGMHLCSCAAKRVQKGGMLVALGVLACAWQQRYEGRRWSSAAVPLRFVGMLKGTYDTWRGTSIKKVDAESLMKNGAPIEMTANCDTTWNKALGTDVYVNGLTVKGAAIDLSLKKVPGAGMSGSSAELEGFALLKMTDRTVYARIVAGRFGYDMTKATVVLCDSEAALRGAFGDISLVRLKHAVRRAAIVKERVHEKEIELWHVPDAACAVDILTKWITGDKLEQALAYLTGGTSKRGTSINVALAAVHDFFWDYHALTTELDELEWADGVEAGVPYKWV